MAKVTFGPIVSEARNKVGGVVFSRNPHGAYSRTWLIPANPSTSAQAAVRLSMRELSQRWSTALSDAQRAAWRSLGIRYPHIDVFRQKSIRPGLQTYLRSNLALASVGSGPLDDAPRKLSASDPAQVTATVVSGSPPVITVNCDSAPAINEAVQIWVSRPLSTGQTYFYKYMRLVATFSAGTAGPWNPSAGWAGRFTSLAFPSKLGIGVRYVNVETGATGPMRTALITATPGGFALTKNTITLTNAQVLALPTTPVELLPALAGNQFYAYFLATLWYRFVNPVTNIDAAAVIRVRQPEPAWLLSANCGASDLLNDAVARATQLPPGQRDVTVDPFKAVYDGVQSLAANIVLEADNMGSGDFTGGDPAATLQVDIYTDVVTV